MWLTSRWCKRSPLRPPTPSGGSSRLWTQASGTSPEGINCTCSPTLSPSGPSTDDLSTDALLDVAARGLEGFRYGHSW